MWVASDPHPSHQGYDGTTRDQHCTTSDSAATPFDECALVATGGAWTFTFTKAGTWKYHNHTGAADVGSITVTAVPTDASMQGSIDAGI